MQLEPQDIDLAASSNTLHPLVEQCRKLLGKLEIISTEINGIENDIEEFVEEYYRRVSVYFKPSIRENHTLESPDKARLFHELSTENKGWSRQEHRKLYLDLINSVHPDRVASERKNTATRKTQKITEAYRENYIHTLWKEKFAQIVNSSNVSNLEKDTAIYDFYHNIRLYLTRQRIYLSRLNSSEENQLRLKVWSARIEGVDLIQSIIQELQRESNVVMPEAEEAPSVNPALLQHCA